MAIITSANAKALLGITVSTYDTQIAALIPVVEKEYLAIRNKSFDTVVKGEKVGVGDGATKTFTLVNKPILASPSDYDLAGSRIASGATEGLTTIYVGGVAVGSSSYSINLTTGVITFASEPAPGKRIEADYEAVNPVYPDGSELTAAQMIGFRLFTSKSIGIKSESLGDHSATFEKDDMIGGYPRSIAGAIERFVKFV